MPGSGGGAGGLSSVDCFGLLCFAVHSRERQEPCWDRIGVARLALLGRAEACFLYMDDEPFASGYKAEKKRGLAGFKTPLGEWVWGWCIGSGWVARQEGKIVQCCLRGSGGRRELLGARARQGLQDLPLRKLQAARLPGYTEARSAAFTRTDRIIFGPISSLHRYLMQCFT